jgi:hypothetical protein
LDGKRKDWIGSFYQPTNGWFTYYIQGFHGQFLFRIPRSEAIKDFPQALAVIKAVAGTTNLILRTPLALSVLEQNPSAEQDADKFLALLREEKLKEIRKNGEEFYRLSIADEQAFAMRWGRIRRFWLNVVFECVLFSGLSLFAFWPWLRHQGPRAWGIHLGLTPLFLLLPYYFGYCGWTFTSAGPSGGVLYPWTIIWFRDWLFWTPVDEWLLVSSPKVLEPLSQTLGPMLSISGGRPPGIIAALLAGIVINGLIWLTIALKWRKENLHKRARANEVPR